MRFAENFAQKYVELVEYSENNLLTSTRSESNCGNLDFNCLFLILYGAYYNTDSLTFYNAYEKLKLAAVLIKTLVFFLNQRIQIEQAGIVRRSQAVKLGAVADAELSVQLL